VADYGEGTIPQLLVMYVVMAVLASFTACVLSDVNAVDISCNEVALCTAVLA
jgi:hypothetical protein